MKTIAAEDLKDLCPSILDRIGVEEVLVTKNGEPVAWLVPIQTNSGGLIGALKGKIRVKGDILSTGVGWDAHS